MQVKNKKREIVNVIIILIIQTIVFIVAGINKSYIHPLYHNCIAKGIHMKKKRQKMRKRLLDARFVSAR